MQDRSGSRQGVSEAALRRLADVACPASLLRPGAGVTAARLALPKLPAQKVLALQAAAGNRAVARRVVAMQGSLDVGGLADPRSSRPLQRMVRIGGGRTRINEAKYKSGWFWWLSPTNWAVNSLIADRVKRVFDSEAELLDYVNGRTDYIGDVHTRNGDTFWFRLPKDKLTVLGEMHQNPDGNIEDVITGLRTKRFKYEPFNEIAPTKVLNIPVTGTQARLNDVNNQYPAAKLTDRANFDPDLENIVVKALTGTAMLRNEFAPDRDNPEWKKRATTQDYSAGDRVALYVAMAIHIAADLAAATLPAPSPADSAFINSARALAAAYTRDKADLDAFMTTKDRDDLIGVFELTAPGRFANLPAMIRFSLAFHEYGSRYIEQLGIDLNDATLKAEGPKLAGNLRAGLQDLGAAREAIMWQKIIAAAGFLIVGMGDAHRTSLKPKLDAAGIAHAEVAAELRRQGQQIDNNWVP